MTFAVWDVSKDVLCATQWIPTKEGEYSLKSFTPLHFNPVVTLAPSVLIPVNFRMSKLFAFSSSRAMFTITSAFPGPSLSCLLGIMILRCVVWMQNAGGVAQWVARLTRDRWIPVSHDFEPHQRPPLFSWARNFIAWYWLVPWTDSSVIYISKNCLFHNRTKIN